MVRFSGFFLASCVLMSSHIVLAFERTSVYEDAQLLDYYISTGQLSYAYDILANYANINGKTSDSNTISAIREHYKSNVFIAPYFEDFKSRSLIGTGADFEDFGEKYLSLNNPSGISVRGTDAIAKFLVERARTELSTYFLQSFRDRLKENKYADLQVLFPVTRDFLMEMDILNYSAIFGLLKSAFESDLRNVLTNIYQLQYSTNFQALLRSSPDFVYLLSMIYLVNSVSNGDHPVDAIEKLANLDYIANDSMTSSTTLNVTNTIKLVGLISKSFRTTDSGKAWVKASDINGSNFSEYKMNIFFGLLIELKQTIVFRGRSGLITFRSFLIQHKDDIATLTQHVGKFLATLDSIDVDITSIRQNVQNGEKVEYAKYKYLLSRIVGLIKNSNTNLLGANDNEVFVWPARYDTLAYYILDVFNNIADRKYSSAVTSGVILLSKSFPDSVWHRRDFIKYSAVMAGIIEAETSDELKDVVEAFVLPAGSSAIKRTNSVNVAFNAFVGGFLGREKLKNRNNNATKWNYGLTIPLGAALSFGLKNNGSLSIFVSGMDLAAPVDFRIGDDSTETLPEFKMENLIAPGIKIIYGYPSSPFATGVGIQYGPRIRRFSVNGQEQRSDAWRIDLMAIGIDIPLLDFYTKPK